MTLEIDVVTLFPEAFPGPLTHPSQAAPWNAAWSAVTAHDLRDWGIGRHRSVDDYPYGGGPGMILRPEPVAEALDALRRPGSTVILHGSWRRALPSGTRPGAGWWLAPRHRLPALRGRRRARPRASWISSCRSATTSSRVANWPPWSSSTPSCASCPAPSMRPRPEDESFSHGLLEYPQYTRPASFRGEAVPDDPAQWRPWCGRPLAQRAGARADPTTATRPARGVTHGLSQARRDRSPHRAPSSPGQARAPCYTARRRGRPAAWPPRSRPTRPFSE